MRRKDREVTERAELEKILNDCKVCRIAMISDGKPYVIPMNYGYTWDENGLVLYFHSGLKGKKIDALNENPQVCFEMDSQHSLTGEGDVACRYSYTFASIVGEGKAEFITDNEQKREVFEHIMYHQTGKRGCWSYGDAHLSVTSVFKIKADSFKGSKKENK